MPTSTRDFSEAALEELLRALRARTSTHPDNPGLIAEGCSNQGVAKRIVVSERAVEKHVTSILSKLGLPAEPAAHRRVLAVLAYLKESNAGAARAGP